jgi:hypothetical protein
MLGEFYVGLEVSTGAQNIYDGLIPKKFHHLKKIGLD